MLNSKRLSPPARAVLVAGLILFLAADIYATYAFFTSRVPGANDFYARWQPLHSWFTTGRNPYSDAATRDTQIGMYGHPARPGDDAFYYPLYSALFFGVPALITPYALASAVWLTMLQVSLFALIGLSLVWSQWRPLPIVFGITLVFAVLWYHSARTVLLGQFAGVEALLLLGAVVAARSGREAWAGILLALATTKPQMGLLLLPGLLLWAVVRRRWALVGWFVIGMALLLGGSYAVLPSSLADWFVQLTTYVDVTPTPGPVAIITEWLLPNAGHWPEYSVDAVLMVYLLWGWVQARQDTGSRFDWAVALTLVVTNLVALRTATTNYVMMIPALFLLFRVAQQRWGRRGMALIVLAEAALFIGLWAIFFATVQGNLEQPVMFLPTPFLLFLGLVLVRPASRQTATVLGPTSTLGPRPRSS